MTNLQSQFTSLEMSKRLVEAGFKAESIYSWGNYSYKNDQEDWQLARNSVGIPAFTFQQLWEALPKGMDTEFTLYEDGLKYERPTHDQPDEIMRWGGYSLPIIDAVAEAVLWCIENNYISVEGNDD